MVRLIPVLLVVAACDFETTIPSMSMPQSDAPQMVAVDAPPPDAPAAMLCTARYGTADQYELCSATSTPTITACVFYAQTNGSSCLALCTGLGGTCIESHDGNCDNIVGNPRPCTDTFSDQVCSCAP